MEDVHAPGASNCYPGQALFLETDVKRLICIQPGSKFARHRSLSYVISSRVCCYRPSPSDGRASAVVINERFGGECIQVTERRTYARTIVGVNATAKSLRLKNET